VGVNTHAMANERARSLRRNRTAAEQRLWWKLRGLRAAGFKFRQQVPIDHYIVDFACFSKRVIVEVDGGTHSTEQERWNDARREQYLRDEGFHVLRFWNADVFHIDGVMDAIVGALGPPPPTPPRKGEERSARHTRRPFRKRTFVAIGLGSPPTSGEHGSDADLARARAIAAAVVDPEIPVLTLEDLGVLRGVERRDGCIVVELTPTYTGCPATLAIRLAVEAALAEAGMPEARVETVLSPPWTTDAITQEGRRKLREFGIAPPAGKASARALFGEETVACPKCGSTATARISEFGSTACKALWRCTSCAEPFDYFKCI
jgi:ring-1,2-phenylacetyl-CoA epoxidase subunit PaaD